jgi:cytochrome P450
MREGAQLDVNLFDGSHVADPFPVYEEIRATGRVVWNGVANGWMITGYDDCYSVVIDSGERFRSLAGDTGLFSGQNMITTDGSEHVRLRRGLAPLFTPKAIAQWEQRVGEVVADLLAPLATGAEGFDLISDFTRVPTIIVAELLGIPEERHDDFRRWSHGIASNLDLQASALDADIFETADAGPNDEFASRRAEFVRSVTELRSYLFGEVERHRREDFDDLLTVMLRAGMADDEIVATGELLMIAGYDTTAKTMANCLVVLEQHPDQRALVAEDPSLLPAAIEEVLRWAGTNHITTRRVARDTEFADTTLRAGDVIFVLFGATGRDPSRWSQPQRFDIHREPKTNLGFGFGPHVCIGAHLARLETRLAIEHLLRIAPEYRLRDVDYGQALVIRGPERGSVDVNAMTPTR